MAINEQACISVIEAEMEAKGFNLGDAPKTKEFVSIMVKNILLEVKKGVVSTTVTGTSPAGAVAGTGVGTIS